ncbi:MAG: pyridoxamine 5-phosphate oxidase-related FMN-binding protein [Clostridia bacterium]|jgi:flavin reductase (DIM6/NTAB) family NADH-FMN oxidoreductase RutF|nr:pyridoxamine 5-phosphate oxidase-related FMN-binding protein [Clostridia bacterium]
MRNSRDNKVDYSINNRGGFLMIPETMLEVMKHEGVVALVTDGAEGAHVVNTWNSYLQVSKDEEILVPVGGMNTTEANLKQNSKLLMTLGSREVQGLMYMGTGFLVSGTAVIKGQGEEFDRIKEKFPWARAVMEIKPESIKQTL